MADNARSIDPANLGNLFQAAIAASGDAILITDADGTIVYVNPAWETLNGYTSEEVRGKNPRFLQSGKTPRTVYEDLWKTLKEGRPFVTESIVNRRKDGTEYSERITISPIRGLPSGSYYLGIVQDVTERKRIEEFRRHVIATIAHQLSTPLGVIRGYLDALLSHPADPLSPAQQQHVRTIIEVSEQSLRLITNLLFVSRLERGLITSKTRPVPLRTIADRVARDYQERASQRGLLLSLAESEVNVVVQADEFLATEALRNLVDNAVKFTEKGSITITIRREGEHGVIDVTDTGKGIPAQALPTLFGTAPSPQQGIDGGHTGSHLGLYIAKEFSRLQHGDLTVSSAMGTGSTFSLLLPLVVV